MNSDNYERETNRKRLVEERMTSSSSRERECVASSRSESDRVESIRTSSVVRTSTMHNVHIEIEFFKN